ncbi:MAG: DUF488 domain-containing protein [Chloroflexi bacterium]|nr:DUF488 domain-containing protein [Chloroflexota bacterium]
MTTIYTIGHSNHDWDTFLPLLKGHGIELLADVRSRPVSRFAPFANKVRFPGLLALENIEYLFMGESLGGRPEDSLLRGDDGRPDYKKMARDGRFAAGIAELTELAGRSATAIMCSEEDPGNCHRLLLIAPALAAHDVDVLHIRKSGELVSQLPLSA